MVFERFRKKILEEGKKHYRDMPWRNTQDPYHILLSEVMLQQTQVDRVIGYYEKFIKKFPTIQDLAKASFVDVLSLWSGLGYNRRAKYLHEAAKKIVEDNGGHIPEDLAALVALPGIGHNTAAAICVYAFNIPHVFIETNIRTVYIYHFYAHGRASVSDKEIEKFLEKTIHTADPRRWYWALMDYGVFLKKTRGNFSQQSTSYRKQSKFEGSLRQLRGKMLRLLLSKNSVNAEILEGAFYGEDSAKVQQALAQLVEEKFIVKDQKGEYYLKT